MPAVCPSNSYLLPPALITLPSQCLLYSHCANNLTRGTLFGPASTSLVTMSLSLSSHLLPLFISDILLNRPLRRRRHDSRPPGPYPSQYSHRDGAQHVLHPSQLWSRCTRGACRVNATSLSVRPRGLPPPWNPRACGARTNTARASARGGAARRCFRRAHKGARRRLARAAGSFAAS